MTKKKTVEAKFALGNISPEIAIQAFVSKEDLQAWWEVSDAIVEAKPGGLYTLVWKRDKESFGYVTTGLVRSYRAANHLLLDKMVYLNPQRSLLGPMSLDIRIVNDGVTDWLRVIQYGYQEGEDWEWYYEAVRVGWPQALQQLEKYLQRKITL